jgi:hypothetical protein
VADRRETHTWFDGERWNLYTERGADMRRFEAWFGSPSRRGRDGEVAFWDDLPPDAVRLHRKRRVAPSASANPGLAAIQKRKGPHALRDRTDASNPSAPKENSFPPGDGPEGAAS